ncbi:IclR family transcriptional regulator [Nocardioides sp. cx-173]|uniref:IclR family transcriptional regulator n=1 Tax=Nocardioides sp. cx-173 TaxID=2898796 RepID=UPI001E5FAF28|nr:IclR family transcriptional regulator [Nocardioides sp. cx-173]MCD4523436.1 IclR family transcriptional regulator [Nocardioides sp. cx-173]UGB42225.1 IclR family transcriptional regulator [Nocardioides sp. cx-173]
MSAPVDVLGRAGALLRAVSAHEPAGATTSVLARASDLARPTAHRLLTSLLTEGLLERDETTGRWLLGPELYLLGAAAASRYDVTAVAQPVVRRLALATGESAFFSARRGDETICLVREDGSFPIRSHVLSEGTRFPLGVASAGMVVLAFLPDPEIEEYLARAHLAAQYGPEHAADRVQARVATTRADGYAVNPGLIVPGSWGMGAAVFDDRERPAWALSLTGIEQRFAADRRRELGGLLLQAAHDLSRALRRPRTS